eukprot:GHVS01057350.1.p1 GENE.GHVS01057350.1~~GHVS01057350.1.p1  ORF type:complete len:132 (-),score=6.66 GHVS01057350.1:279-674(-)
MLSGRRCWTTFRCSNLGYSNYSVAFILTSVCNLQKELKAKVEAELKKNSREIANVKAAGPYPRSFCAESGFSDVESTISLMDKEFTVTTRISNGAFDCRLGEMTIGLSSEFGDAQQNKIFAVVHYLYVKTR